MPTAIIIGEEAATQTARHRPLIAPRLYHAALDADRLTVQAVAAVALSRGTRARDARHEIMTG
jgi:hypothetical protein